MAEPEGQYYKPIRVWVGDRVHEFEPGTPMGVIQAEMASRYPDKVAPSIPGAPPGGAPATPAPSMPPGTTPSGVVVKPGAPEANVPDLSERAKQMQQFMLWKAFKGDEHGANAARQLLEQDPTYQVRRKAFDVMGQTAGDISKKQQYGQEALGMMEDWRNWIRAWHEHNPKAVEAAIGPWNSDPTVQKYTGFSNRAAQEFAKGNDHYIDALTKLSGSVLSGGPNSEGDANRFLAAIGEGVKQPTIQGAEAVMEKAQDLIRRSAQLPSDYELPEHRGMGQAEIDLINKYAGAKKVSPGSRYQPYEPNNHDETYQVPHGSYFLYPIKPGGGRKLVYSAADLEAAAALPPGTVFMLPTGQLGRVRRNQPPGAPAAERAQ